MKRIFSVCLLLIFAALAYGQKAEETKITNEKIFTGDRVEFTCKRPNTDESIPLKVVLVYQPANADDYYEPPRIEFEARCEGECKAEAIPENIEGYIQRLKDGWKKLSTGNPELDILGTNVEIIKEEKSEGQWLFEVKLTYPKGVSSAMYPPRYWIYRFLHNAQDPFFILIKGKVPVSLDDQFLSDVYASCLSTAKL